MVYKTILTHVRNDATSRAQARLAMTVAKMFDATVYGVAAETWLPIALRPEYAYCAPGDCKRLNRQTHDRLEAARNNFAKLSVDSGRPFLWSSVEDYPREALIQAARAADLVVAGRASPADTEGIGVFPGDLVMATGLPVLLAADQLCTIRAERVVVAWKNTREARRAVSDALPFLRRAKETHLIHVADASGLRAASADLDEAAGRLTRHGLAVHTHALTECPDDVCEALETFARAKGCDLIVLGAYGHSRLRELVFGGVTQGFLTHGAFHLLFSR